MKLVGQLDAERCAICGEHAVAEIEITPAVIKKNEIEHAAVKRWLCEAHKVSVERSRGWQERAAKQRREARLKLRKATEEAQSFDPLAGRPVGWELRER